MFPFLQETGVRVRRLLLRGLVEFRVGVNSDPRNVGVETFSQLVIRMRVIGVQVVPLSVGQSLGGRDFQEDRVLGYEGVWDFSSRRTN